MLSERYHLIYPAAHDQHKIDNNRQPSMRLLWASRIREQKRPELLPLLAKELTSLFPDLIIEIHVHIDSGYNPGKLFNSPIQGLQYAGTYNDFDLLPLSNFDALIYTSAFDSMPYVVLEALAAGLPVIAADVGGINEAVISGQTGYLIPDEVNNNALVDCYVSAIKKLYDDWETTQAMAQTAYKIIADRHAPATFAQRISEAFCLASGTKQDQPKPISQVK